MALGIVAFAFTTLLGLLPVGLGLFRDALDISVTSRITQRLVSDMQQTDFNSVLNAGGSHLYFDDQGNQKPTNDIYWTHVSVFPSTSLPQLAGTGTANTDLARVVVQIAYNPAGRPIPTAADGTWQGSNDVPVTKRAFFIARNTTTVGS